MEQLHYYYQVVEKAITKIGLDPTACRKKPGQWSLTKGQIPIWIDVFYLEREKNIYFQVAAPIMKIPQDNAGRLAMDLLQLNNQLFGVAFTANKGHIYLKTLRETEGLDISEANAMILRIGNYADQYDNELKKRYPEWHQATFDSSQINPN
ncbi:MAG: YbjN domain-containing protein [Saprospiraceae bacterium]|nr:YbjN domain-containing protein [Saprospiraceae bacterium]